MRLVDRFSLQPVSEGSLLLKKKKPEDLLISAFPVGSSPHEQSPYLYCPVATVGSPFHHHLLNTVAVYVDSESLFSFILYIVLHFVYILQQNPSC